MEVAVAMIWFAFCCVYMVLFSAVVASKENFTGYDVNLTAITNRNLSHDESLDNSAFALPQTTDVDSFTSNSSYKATEVPNRQLFNIEVLQPVSGHLLTPTIDVGNVCSCDELEDLCDINCCCDKECSQELALFTGCTMLTLSGNNQFCSHATASYALQYTVEGYSQLQSFVQQEMYHDSFCIQSHNRLAGFHFPAPTLPLARNFDSLFTQFNKFAFSSLENNDMSTNILAELQKFYQYGDAIMSAKENGKSGFLYLPSSSISVDCVDQSPVAFLVDRQSRCSRRVDLKEDCSSRPSISIDTYTNINLYAGRNGGATGDETQYRLEVDLLATWCRDNNLLLNVDKTKEIVVDFRKGHTQNLPLTIDGAVVERVSSAKFLGVHISEDLSWSTNTASLTKKAQRRLYFLQKLRRASAPPAVMTTFYRGTIESVLSSCIAVWGGGCTDYNLKALQRIVNTAGKIIGASLPSLKDIYTSHLTRKATTIVSDVSHPAHSLFELLPSGKRYRSLRSRTTRLSNSFILQAVRILNSLPRSA
ncbi:tectonic-2 isoform 19-T24 [Syngnathus typhle]